MKRLISTHITGKMFAGLLAAEIISLVMAVFITLFITKPRMERETLDQAVTDGQRLAAEIDGILENMCQTVEYLCSSPSFKAAIETAETGQPGALRAELEGICRFDSLNIRGAAAHTEALGWFLSDSPLSPSDEMALLSPSMVGLSEEKPGPMVANIYSGWETNDTLSVGMAAQSGSGALWRFVFLFQSDELKRAITNALSYDYAGFEIGKVGGPGFFSGGDSANAHGILAANTKTGSYTLWDSGGLYVITQTGYNWRICGYISRAEFVSAYMPALKNALLLCLLMFMVSLAILLPLTRGMLRPIGTLRQAMTTAASGNLEVRAEIPTQDEFHQLGAYFNNMLDQIKAHTDDAIKLEASELNLRHSLLVSQINYHFIYNAMSTINSLARKGECATIIRLNSALADILQEDMLVQNGKMTCALGRELSVVENFWRIESISRKGQAELTIQCSDELRPIEIPRNILQPLVENSLRHGIVDEESGELRGHVQVWARREENSLCLGVSDNGRGIEPDTLQSLRASQKDESDGRHIGIANIRKRLEYLYGDRAVLLIESGAGTTITIKIPI